MCARMCADKYQKTQTSYLSVFLCAWICSNPVSRLVEKYRKSLQIKDLRFFVAWKSCEQDVCNILLRMGIA
jgi:hypothetical protein